MQIADDSTVIVSKGTFVELRSEDTRVTLIREGAYTVKTITTVATSTHRPGFIESLGGKISGVMKDSEGEAALAALAADDFGTAVKEFEYALNVVLLYKRPSSTRGNAVGVFKAFGRRQTQF